jgi:hypothetical protein
LWNAKLAKKGQEREGGGLLDPIRFTIMKLIPLASLYPSYLHLRSIGVVGVVKYRVVDTTPRPTLVNAVTEMSEIVVLGISDWMVNSVVAAPVMFVIREPPLTLWVTSYWVITPLGASGAAQVSCTDVNSGLTMKLDTGPGAVLCAEIGHKLNITSIEAYQLHL